MAYSIFVTGIFVADTAYRTNRMPKTGETILGNSFALGPGGKGSNQAVAAARAGGDVAFYTKIGKDPFGNMALSLWEDAGVTILATQHEEEATGAACIMVDENTGNNAIIVCPGVAGTISIDDMNTHSDAIGNAKVFLTQLEQPIEVAHQGLKLARAAGAITILNPAPAAGLEDDLLSLCDYITPNETETEALTGLPVASVADARRAAEALLKRGVGKVVVTLGEAGALYHDREQSFHVPAMTAGRVVETTGAGDAFNGALAVALSEGRDAREAVRFANACAAISVTRPGAAASMPAKSEIDDLLKA